MKRFLLIITIFLLVSCQQEGFVQVSGEEEVYELITVHDNPHSLDDGPYVYNIWINIDKNLDAFQYVDTFNNALDTMNSEDITLRCMTCGY